MASEKFQFYEEFLTAIRSLDAYRTRELLDGGHTFEFCDEFGQSLFHLIQTNLQTTEIAFSNINHSDAKGDICRMLIDAGIDLELKDKNGNTCLWYAVENKDARFCDVLLQCGADIWAENEKGHSIFDEVFNNSLQNKHPNETTLSHDSDIEIVFQKYYPGLLRAVESRDIYQVRRLVNLWCKTDLQKDGKTLKDLALDSGHEEIISLIFGIHDTMKMVHHILAKNTKAVCKLFETSCKSLQLDLRKMSERGAPILYFLIQWKDATLIELFIKHGCHVYTVMRDEFGFDMPVLFSALKQNIPVQVVKALLPKNKLQQEEMLYKLLYKGRTILEVALEQKVSLEVFSVIVDRGGPLLIMDRNQFNQSVRDVAIISNSKEYADIIDKNVSSWIMQLEKYPGRRKALALYGWEHMDVMFQNEKDFEGTQVKEFLSHLSAYQTQIKKLVEATESGNCDRFHDLSFFPCELNLFENSLSWDGRLKGDGLPILHRAVLFNHHNLVRAILKHKPDSQSVDTLFDQNHRTALHYAYANPSATEVRKLLLDSGCSEHVLDKKNKEPLDFKDKQGHSLLLQLLNRLKSKEYHLPEPDPWEDLQSKSQTEDLICLTNTNCCSENNEINTNQLEGKITDDEVENFDDDESSDFPEEETPPNCEENNRAYCNIV